MGIDNDALLAAIDAGKENAYGSDEQSQLGQKRAKAIEYYLGLNTNPAPEGRSQVVDRSVYETISVMLPSLVRIFAGSSDQVCKLEPIGPEDEQGAEQASAVINHVVAQLNPWEQICADWIHDAMLLMNGYCMAYYDESETRIRERYEGQSEDQLAAIMADTGVRVVEQARRIDKQATAEQQEQYRSAVMQHRQMSALAALQGMPAPPPPQPPGPVVLYDITIERVENKGQVCIEVLPPEHCKVSSETPDWTLKRCPYFEFRQQKTIAELQSMGLKVPEGISDNEDEDENPEDHARDRLGEDRDDDTGKGVMRRVWARMIWVKADAEGDGESRMYYVIAVGRTILHSEQVSSIHVSSMTPQPLPHRHIGMAVGETVHDIQDIRTAVTRGGLDNLYLSNNGRYAVSDRVNVEDLLDSRPGGVVRMLDSSDPGQNIAPLEHPFAFGEIIQSLEYIDQIRQNRTGASRYFSGTDAGAINKTASGTMALQNMASSRVEHIARTIAPAFERLFEIVQELVAKHENKTMTIKLRGNGEWVTVDPQAWRTKRDVRISVGVGAGNKDTMLAQLQMQLAMQMQLSAAGLAGPKEMYESCIEIGKLQGYANPGKFWVDVNKNPPQPQPNPEMLKIQAEVQGKQIDAQLKERELQQKMQFEERMAQLDERLKMLDIAIKERELQFKGEEMQMRREGLQLKGQEQHMNLQASTVKHGMDMEKGAMQMQMADKETSKAKEMDGLVEKVSKKVMEAMDGMRVVGIEKIKDLKTGKTTGARRKYANGKTEDVPIQ